MDNRLKFHFRFLLCHLTHGLIRTNGISNLLDWTKNRCCWNWKISIKWNIYFVMTHPYDASREILWMWNSGRMFPFVGWNLKFESGRFYIFHKNSSKKYFLKNISSHLWLSLSRSPRYGLVSWYYYKSTNRSPIRKALFCSFSSSFCSATVKV